MTNYIITVGTSVLTNFVEGKGFENGPAEGFDELVRTMLDCPKSPGPRRHLEARWSRHQLISRWRAAELRESEATGGNPLTDFADLIEDLDPEQSPTSSWDLADLCAEGASLKAATGGSSIELDRHDRLNLIVSDTNDGVLAALIVGWLFARRLEVQRITAEGAGATRHAASIGQGVAAIACLWIVDGLTAKRAESFERSMQPLGMAVGLALEPTGSNLVLLSGGYKAVPPHVVACCEYLRFFGELSVQIKFEYGTEPFHMALRPVGRGWGERLGRADSDPKPIASSDPLYGWAIDATGALTGIGRVLLGASLTRVGPL